MLNLISVRIKVFKKITRFCQLILEFSLKKNVLGKSISDEHSHENCDITHIVHTSY